MEYYEALKSDIEVLIFLAQEDADWPAEYAEELKRDAAIKQWRDELQKYTVGYFTPEPMSVDVDSALLRWSEKARHEGTPRRTASDDESFAIRIRAYCNSGSVLIAWQTKKPILGCLGFALYRRTLTDSGIEEAPVRTWMGFAGQSQTGAARSSRIQPIQKFSWVDVPDTDNDTRYCVVPILGSPEALAEPGEPRGGSGWTAWISRRTSHTQGYQSFFNRVSRGAAGARALGKTANLSEAKWLRLKGEEKLSSRDYFGGQLRPNYCNCCGEPKNTVSVFMSSCQKLKMKTLSKRWRILEGFCLLSSGKMKRIWRSNIVVQGVETLESAVVLLPVELMFTARVNRNTKVHLATTRFSAITGERQVECGSEAQVGRRPRFACARMMPCLSTRLNWRGPT